MIPLFCPLDMVAVPNASACIEIRAWPGYAEQSPLFGLSALPEVYLAQDGVTWDAESLCASRGRRLCSAREWSAACEGLSRASCGRVVPYLAPSWNLVNRRDDGELLRLNQWSPVESCVSPSGTVGQLMAQEWVRVGIGYAISASYWSRAGDCRLFVRTHAPNWHDYATTVRCCVDA